MLQIQKIRTDKDSIIKNILNGNKDSVNNLIEREDVSSISFVG